MSLPTPLMSWQGDRLKRWDKRHEGVRHYVTCKTLGVPKSERRENSAVNIRAANEWWAATLASLTATAKVESAVVAELRGRLDVSQRTGDTATAKAIQATLDDTELMKDEDAVKLIVRGSGQVTGAVWAERLKAVTRPGNDERRIGALVDKWNASRLKESVAPDGKKRKKSAARADNLRRGSVHFVAHFGKDSLIDVIDYDRWHEWFLFVESNEKWPAVSTKEKWFGISRSIVAEWAERKLLVPPGNLYSKKHVFESHEKRPTSFTDDEVRLLLTSATDYHRLILLLMLNCGFTSADVGELRRDEIVNGRIVRVRSKMQGRRSGFDVGHLLWDSTRELLERFGEKSGELLLTTKSGGKWSWDEIRTDGTFHKSDNVATIFNNLKRKLIKSGVGASLKGAGKSAKIFRKSAASKLRSSTDHKAARHYFMGHAEKNMTDRKYSPITQTELDEAVKWLGKQWGL